MSRFVKFLLTGLAFAAPGEFLTCFFIKLSADAFAGALILYSLILVFAYLLDRLIDGAFRSKTAADLVYFLVVGAVGLMSEWAIGNTPWGNPRASQFSMFMYHVTTYFMPRLFLDPRGWVAGIRKAILWYSIPCFTAVLVTALLLPQPFRLFWLVILTFYMGYNLLLIFYLWYFAAGLREKPGR